MSLKPRIGVPQEIRRQFVSLAVTGFVTFAPAGFYAALIPNLLSESMNLTSPAASGAVVFVLFAVAAVSVLATSRLSSHIAMQAALVLLIPSVWLLVVAEIVRSPPVLLAATVLGGIACGLGCRGSLETTNEIAPDERRSEVISSYLIAVYAGNSVPVIGIGFLSAATGTLTPHVSFAAVITLLAIGALIVGILMGRQGSAAQRASA